MMLHGGHVFRLDRMKGKDEVSYVSYWGCYKYHATTNKCKARITMDADGAKKYSGSHNHPEVAPDDPILQRFK